MGNFDNSAEHTSAIFSELSIMVKVCIYLQLLNTKLVIPHACNYWHIEDEDNIFFGK
jgi:hypothetical protein